MKNERIKKSKEINKYEKIKKGKNKILVERKDKLRNVLKVLVELKK
jgi:hypothetical protein